MEYMDKMMEKMFEMCKEMENMPFMKNTKKDKKMEKCCDKMRDVDIPKMGYWCEMMRKGDFNSSKFFK